MHIQPNICMERYKTCINARISRYEMVSLFSCANLIAFGASVHE